MFVEKVVRTSLPISRKGISIDEFRSEGAVRAMRPKARIPWMPSSHHQIGERDFPFFRAD